MTPLALLAIVLLPFAAETPEPPAAPPLPSSSTPAASRTVDEGDALHADRDRVFLDWGAESRVLRMRAKRPSPPRGDDVLSSRLVLSSGEPVSASREPHTSDVEPVHAVTNPEKRAPRAPRVKKTVLQSLSTLAEMLAGGHPRRTSASSASGTPLPHFDARDDETRRVGHPRR